MIRYEVIALDVWGSARDGYDVNNWHPTGEHLCLTDDIPPGHRQIVSALKVAGFIKKNVRYSSIAILGHGDTLTVEDARTGEPLYNLEKMP